MASSRVLRGADVKVFINGRIFPGAVSFRFSASTGTHSIMGIDQGQPFELVPGPQKVTGSMDVLRIRNSAGLEGVGVVPPDAKLLLGKYFSLVVIDRVTDTVVLELERAALIEQNWSFATRQIVTGSFSFEGLGWANEFQSQ